jgi:hypothetical protein
MRRPFGDYMAPTAGAVHRKRAQGSFRRRNFRAQTTGWRPAGAALPAAANIVMRASGR